MTAKKRRELFERARGACEYCKLPLEYDLLPWHVDHIIPVQHGGLDDESNLAVACARCNLGKGPNLTGIDPATNRITPLFDPRRQRWLDHFTVSDVEILGISHTGRASVIVFQLNAPRRLDFRRRLIRAGLL